MREVDVYTVSVERAFVANGQEVFQYFSAQDLAPVYGKDAAIEATYTTHTIPIEHWVDNGKHYYIAIQPEVTKLLDAKYNAMYKERLAEKDRVIAVKQAYINVLLERVNHINNLPWYSRIWKAIFKEV